MATPDELEEARQIFESMKGYFESIPFSLGDFELNNSLGEIREQITKLQMDFDQAEHSDSVSDDVLDRLEIRGLELSAMAKRFASDMGRKSGRPSNH